MNSNFDFDLGLGSSRPKSLNDQKNKTSSFSSSATAAQPDPPGNNPPPAEPPPGPTSQLRPRAPDPD
ncbi:hypothetical protein ACFX1S_012359 [Malus domestica]